MFTGLVEELGAIASIARDGGGARLTLDAPGMAGGIATGDSVAVNGVCLTAVEVNGARLTFEAVPETLRRTTLGELRAGDRVNLERSLAAGARIGGHFVQGHVDGTARLASAESVENARVLRVEPEQELMRCIAPKGSVALDGISLTVADVADSWFSVWIIPHTLACTTLQFRRAGDRLNIEVDMLARYLERLLAVREPHSAITPERLAAAGFME